MADLTITAANVALGSASTARVSVIQAGATIARGEPYYLDANDSRKAKLAYANDTTASEAEGIALTGATSGNYFVGITEGEFTPGATLTAGVSYYVSRNAGKIAPYGDLTTNDRITHLFRAKTTALAIVAIDASGITL